MKSRVKKIREFLTEIVAIGLTFLGLGIIVQLLIDDTILGWDPVGNVQSGGTAFIGIITITLLYILFIRNKNKTI